MEKTLVILIGNARGGEETWETMYKHLLKPSKGIRNRNTKQK